MSDIAIQAENLGKLYHIGQTVGYQTLRESIVNAAAAPFKYFRFLNHKPENDATAVIWALKNVSFEVKHGDAIGIIGGNGSGKSTLLKILSRITTPTEGNANIHGRVASLLEVGTGFHPELTGRENIYLNGAVLGMKKTEIARKFDEIVAFAEVDKFLDTPVKRYSSGMYVRLAFAVAAHLEPEILIVDEVLAVGDAQFQTKCLGKMNDVAKGGRTVLFVSHNMQAVRQLCETAILLNSGKIIMSGRATDVVDKYLNSISVKEQKATVEEMIQMLPPDPVIRLESISLTQGDRPVYNQVLNGLPLEIEIRYQVLKKTAGLRVYFDVCDAEDTLLFRSFHDEDNDSIPELYPGRYVSRAFIPADLLGPFIYQLHVRATIFNVRTCIPPGIVIPLTVVATGRYNRAYVGDTSRGKITPVIPWNTRKL